MVVGSEIAQGGYSFVYRATDAFTGEVFALKKILAQTEDQQAAALNEIKIHKSFDHPNIMPLTDYGIVSEGVQHLEYYLLFPMMEVQQCPLAIGSCRDLNHPLSELEWHATAYD